MIQLARRDLLIGAAASLAACASGPPQLPAGTGAWKTQLVDPADGRTLPLRIAFPVRGSGLPVVLFSHGLYSSGDDYNPILDDWAARGYVVIAPTHRDSVTLGVQRGTFDQRFLPWRMADMQLILGQLPQVLGTVAGLLPRAQPARIAATGHSIGGLVAQSLSGATCVDSPTGATVRQVDPRVRATVIISGPGLIPGIVSLADFAGLSGPTLVSVGTNDLKQDPNLTGYEWRRQPYDLAPPGGKFLLTLDGADHYLGGSVGRDDLAPDPDGLRYLAAFNAVSGQFLDAYLRDGPDARAWLRDHAGGPGGLPPLAALAAR